MMRLFGACTLLGILGYTAWSTVREERKRLAVLDAWIALLYYIRNQIDCFSLPLHQIFVSADKSLFKTLGDDGALPSAESLFHASEPLLDEDCAALLRSWVSEIGGSHREQQVKRCDYYLKELEALRDKRKSALPHRTRLLVTLHLCAGLGAVILLW